MCRTRFRSPQDQSHSGDTEEIQIGKSVEGRAIIAYRRIAQTARTTLILGGMHGDEPKSVSVARGLVEYLTKHPSCARDSTWVIVPVVNPDGYERRNRRNANRVDINRNFPTCNWATSSRRSRMYGGSEPASEPETQAVMRIVGQVSPTAIITIHSIGGERYCNNFDGPGAELAQSLHRFNGYPVTPTIGYPTPGSFGTWAGHELRIPVVTLELPSLHSAKRCSLDNLDALLSLHQPA